MAYIDVAGYGHPNRSTHGRIAKQVVQAPVKINAVTDFDDIAQRKQTAPSKRLFPFMDLDNTTTEAQFTAHEGNIAFVQRSALLTPARMTSMGNGMSLDVRVPVSTTLNGLAVEAGTDKSIAHKVLESRLVPVGLVAEQNRNNGESMFGVQHGGSFPYTNNSTGAHNAFDLICARVPDPAKMGSYPSSSVEADRIKSGGRVELIFERYDPHNLNIANAARMRALFAQAASKKPESHLAPHERQLLITLMRGIVAANALDAALGLSNAGLTSASDDAACMKLAEKLNEKKDLFFGNEKHVEAWLAVLGMSAAFKHEEARLIIGQALTSTASGADGVLHIGSYMA